MNYIDITLALILIISVGIGIYRGFVKEILFLTNLIVAAVVALYSSDYLAEWLAPTAGDWGGEWVGIELKGTTLVFIVSFVGIFFAVLFAFSLISSALSDWVSQNAVLKGFNRVLGGAFGLLRGALIAILLVVLAGLTKVSIYPWWQESQLLPPFINGAELIVSWLPSQYSWHFDFSLPPVLEGDPAELMPTPEHGMENTEKQTI